MIIVSQDRKTIVNFNQARGIWIDNEISDKTDIANIMIEICADGELLGEYKTEERAKKILEEVIKCYANTEQYKCLSSMPNCATEEKVNVLNELAENAFVYEMPKE